MMHEVSERHMVVHENDWCALEGVILALAAAGEIPPESMTDINARIDRVERENERRRGVDMDAPSEVIALP